MNLRVSDVVRLKTGGLIRIGVLGALDSVWRRTKTRLTNCLQSPPYRQVRWFMRILGPRISN
jgi:hypothetical protein